MEQSKLHIRLDFAPLDVAVSLSVLSSGSPVTQTYNASTGEYELNRQLTPTVIYPNITLTAQDGSLETTYGNQNLATQYIKWYVDDEEVSAVWTAGTDYEIITEGEYIGGIRVYKNLEPLEQHVLHFEGVINDPRTGTNYEVVSEGIILSTLEMSEDAICTLCMDSDTAIQYDPFYDRLFEYEYKVAHGYAEDTTKGREQATDINSYAKEIPLTLFRGDGIYEGEYTVRVFEILGWQDNVLQTEEITITDDDDNEFDEISPDKLVMDLRMVESKDYIVVAYINDEEVAHIQFGVRRLHTQYSVMSVNGASRKIGDTERRDVCYVMSNARRLDYPESVIRLLWKTDTQYLTGVEHGEGASVEYTIASTGAGDTADDGWIDEYIESEQKDVHAVALSEDDEVYCDENENTIIFN